MTRRNLKCQAKPFGLEIMAFDSSEVTISGGQFMAQENLEPEERPIPFHIEATNDAVVHLFGTELSLTEQSIRGILADGSEIDFTYEGNVEIHVVPEPGAFGLAWIGSLAYLIGHRRW